MSINNNDMKHEIQMTINHDDIHLWSFCRNFLYLLPRQNIVNECLFVITKTIFVQIFFLHRIFLDTDFVPHLHD